MELFVDEVAGGGTRERAFCLEQQEPNQMAINWKENKELLVTDVAWWLLPGTPFITVPKKEKRKKKDFSRRRVQQTTQSTRRVIKCTRNNRRSLLAVLNAPAFF